MMEIKKVTAKMVPALESISSQPTIGDIGPVPAVRVELKYGDQTLDSIGIIDTGADLCVLDEYVFKMFTSVQAQGIAVIATGFSKQQVILQHLDIKLLGDEPNQVIEIKNAPVAIARLDRRMLIIGRRGVLERLRVELDFPRNQLNLILVYPATNKYPALINEFPTFNLAIKSLEESRFEQAIMEVAWAMERFLDTIIVENPVLIPRKDEGRPPRTLWDKLQLICQAKKITDLTSEIQDFVVARNEVAHNRASEIDRISTERVLEAAETIVSRLIGTKMST